MNRKILSIVFMTWGLGGCVYTIDSAIPDESANSIPAMVGTWVSAQSERAVVTSAQGSTYRVRYTERGADTASLHVRFGRLGEHTVLEVWPAYDDEDSTWPIGRLLIVIDVAADEVRTRSLNTDSLKAALARNAPRVPYLARNHDIVLTAATSVLAPMLTEFLRRPGVLDEGEVWRRQK